MNHNESVNGNRYEIPLSHSDRYWWAILSVLLICGGAWAFESGAYTLPVDEPDSIRLTTPLSFTTRSTLQSMWTFKVEGDLQDVALGPLFPHTVVTSRKMYFFDGAGREERALTLVQGERGQAVSEERYAIGGVLKEDRGPWCLFDRQGGTIAAFEDLPGKRFVSDDGQAIIALRRIYQPKNNRSEIWFLDAKGVSVRQWKLPLVLDAVLSPKKKMFFALENQGIHSTLCAFSLDGQLIWHRDLPGEYIGGVDTGTLQVSPEGDFVATQLLSRFGNEKFTRVFDRMNREIARWDVAQYRLRFMPHDPAVMLAYNSRWANEGVTASVFDLVKKGVKSVPVPGTAYAPFVHRNADLSPDEEWLVIHRRWDHTPRLRMVNLKGNPHRELVIPEIDGMYNADEDPFQVTFARDGRHLLFSYFESKQQARAMVRNPEWLATEDGKRLAKAVDLPEILMFRMP